jgi:ribose transport system substrate-binding protein
MNGEDQQDFLQKWKADKMTAIAPTYPTYQWRTAVIAAVRVLKGEQVIGPKWKLPEPSITQDNLANYLNPAMPPLHYAMCGCEKMPDYPKRWAGK